MKPKIVDEILAADKSEPEASFDNTADMLAYLNDTPSSVSTPAQDATVLMREAIRQAMEDRPGWYDTCREALRSTPSASAGPQAEADAIAEERKVVPGREDRYLLAHELEQARDAYLNGLGQLGSPDRKDKFERLLWNDKAGIIEALRIAALAHPQPQQADGRGAVVEAIRLLQKISDLAYDDDVGEPLDCAIDYANKALAALSQAPATDGPAK